MSHEKPAKSDEWYTRYWFFHGYPSSFQRKKRQAMNNTEKRWQRNALKKMLDKLPQDHQLLFKRMYSHLNDGCEPTDFSASIKYIIDHMDSSKLRWALIQAQRSLIQLQKTKNEQKNTQSPAPKSITETGTTPSQTCQKQK